MIRIGALIVGAALFWAAFIGLTARAFPPAPARCPDWMETHWGRCP